MKDEINQDIMLFEQRVYKGEICISYCLKNYSKRTESGYLKIKAMQKACYMYEE